MKRTLSVFFAGILVGFALWHFLNRPHRHRVHEEVVAEVPEAPQEETPAPKKAPAKKEMVLLGTQKLYRPLIRDVPTPSVLAVKREILAQKEDPKKSLNFQISEAQIDAMEAQLPELQKEVSLFREQNGWLVRLHGHENLFAAIGVEDNDFIRFTQFDDMKKNPATEHLASRLEDILSNLER